MYSTYLGGSGDGSGDGDTAYALTVNSFGNAYVTGETFSSNFPIKNAFQTTNHGAGDAFVTILTPCATTNAQLAYSTYLGGMFEDLGEGIALPKTGQVSVVGSTSISNGDKNDFPTTLNAYQLASAGPSAFISVLEPPSVPMPTTSLSATKLSFTAKDHSSESMKLTIENKGMGCLMGTLSSLSAPFSVSPSPGAFFTLGPSKTLQATVKFAPTKTGSFNETLKVTSNDPKNPSESVKLTGTGD